MTVVRIAVETGPSRWTKGISLLPEYERRAEYRCLRQGCSVALAYVLYGPPVHADAKCIREPLTDSPRSISVLNHSVWVNQI